MTGKKVRVRGRHLVHDGVGYHDEELELDEKLAAYYVAMGTAVVVEPTVVQSEPGPAAPVPPKGVPSPKAE
jgi:hypothetical protein